MARPAVAASRAGRRWPVSSARAGVAAGVALVALLAPAVAPAVRAAGAVGLGGHPGDVADSDHDGLRNFEDNCPGNWNPDQLDSDGDAGVPRLEATGTPLDAAPATGGDACDVDDDNDGVSDRPKRDNCPLAANADQRDSDFDGVGDACDADPEPEPDPGPPPVPPPPPDHAAPELVLSLAPAYRLDAIRAGIAVRVLCSEACALSGELLVAGTGARLLGMARAAAGPTTIGRGAGRLEGAGVTYVFVRLPAATRRRIARTGGVRGLIRVAALDAAGNRTALDRPVVLRAARRRARGGH